MNTKLDWKQIFQAVSDGLIIIDRRFQIRYVNPAFSAMTGKPEASLIGRTCYEAFQGPLCRSPGCPVLRAGAGQDSVKYDGEVHCKCDSSVPSVVHVAALRNTKGDLIGIVETVTDVSILKRTQRELIKSHERLRKAMGGIIQAMSLTIEKRDPYTAGHQRRVAKLCRAIGTELRLNWECIQGLRMAAAIHDLGKINVPAAILNKPGVLSEHEMAIIRQHPQTAYEILKGIEFPWPIARSIHQHHERMDGSGYPLGIKGEQIILEARILAVADVVEAISCFRPYRPGLGIDHALMEIKNGRGVHYDPTVVDICLRVFTEWGFAFKSKYQRCVSPPGNAP
jgi:PAS domain S-box-containing protein